MLFLLPSLRKTKGLMKVGASDMKIYVALPLTPLPREGDLPSLRSYLFMLFLLPSLRKKLCLCGLTGSLAGGTALLP